MNTRATIVRIIGLALLLAGCGESRNAEPAPANMSAVESRSAPANTTTEAPQAGSAAVADSVGTAASPPSDRAATSVPISSSAAVETGTDTTRKFVRTAEIKFRVKNVVAATYEIEDITNRMNGFVAYTNLNSTIDNKTTTAISSDSSLEATYYTVVNSMTLRVPNTALDTTLKSIAHLIDYLDSRVIRADNVSLRILASDMARKRLQEHQVRLRSAIDRRGRSLEETTSAEENLLNRQGESDETTISNLELNDQIQYSTINLSIYQRQAITKVVLPNDKNIDEYTPGVGSRIAESLYAGRRALESATVFLMQFWALYILLAIGWIIYRKFREK